ncbi:hypothetical protein Tco_1388413 [Tanacetum coccineum]
MLWLSLHATRHFSSLQMFQKPYMRSVSDFVHRHDTFYRFKYEEVRKKSLMDFYKTHPSGSGITTKPTPSAAIIKPSVTNKGTGVKPGVPNVTEEESSKSEAESWGNNDDDSNNDQDSGSEESNQDKVVMMTNPNQTIKMSQIPSMKLMIMNLVPSLIKKKMMKRLKMLNVTPPDGAWMEYVSEGATSS